MTIVEKVNAIKPSADRKAMILSFRMITMLMMFFFEAENVNAKENVSIKSAQVVLTESLNQESLNLHMFYLEDTLSEWTIEEIASPLKKSQFRLNEDSIFNVGYTNSSYWVKVELLFKPKSFLKSKDFLIEVAYPQLNVAELYIPQKKSGFSIQIADSSHPFSSREIKHVNSVFPVTLEANQAQTFYFKFKTSTSFILPITVWDPEAFTEKVAVEEFYYGIFYGCMLAMIIYNLCVFMIVRDKSYLYYVVYTSCFLMVQIIIKGHGITLFGDDAELIDKVYLPYILWFSWMAVVQMTRQFLYTKERYPSLDMLLRLLFIVAVASFFLSFTAPLGIAMRWTVINSFVYLSVILFVAFYSWQQGNSSARFFLLAWLSLLVCLFAYAGVVLAIFPANAFTALAPQIGLVAEATFRSFALADRIKLHENQTDEANKYAMKQLRHYQSIFEHAVEGLYRVSLSDRFTNANLSLVTFLGYASQASFKQANINAMTACFYDPQVRMQVVEVLGKQGSIHDFEAQYQRQDGTLYWANHSINVIHDDSGKASHLEGTFVDITEQKEKEQAVLDREVSKAKQKVANASTSAKSAFLANMSHEIRTPLTAIIGYTESLQDVITDKAAKHHAVQTIVKSGHHLLNLINDILDFSTIESKSLDIKLGQVDLLPLMLEIETYFENMASEKGLGFTIIYHYPLPKHIQTDTTRLKQILLNLCSNAFKFTKKGGVVIDVSYELSTKLVSFNVKDTGIGLTEAQQLTLFDAFTQADASTAREFGGTGLGLMISKQLAELMGGTISVNSTKGQGSQFTVSISGGLSEREEWVTSNSDAHQMVQNKPDKPTSTITIPTLNGHVLYAEDGPDNQRLVKLLLEKTGAKLTIVDNGKKAVEALENTDFDLILMDVQMPIMNGIEATIAIREQGFQKPIIAFTANMMKEEVEHYKAIGCDGCMGKPVDRPLFYKTLAKYIGRAM
ncbi:MAG: PAS domain S-box-containing protein [Oleiphilaceae bacterium]